MKVCEICGSEEKWDDEEEEEELLLGVCAECMKDFGQG